MELRMACKKALNETFFRDDRERKEKFNFLIVKLVIVHEDELYKHS